MATHYLPTELKISDMTQMLFFLISCFSFLLLSKSLTFKPIHGRFCKNLKLAVRKLSPTFIKKACLSSETERKPENEGKETPLLDLPELALDCILEKLPPSGLCRMGQVCASMRERCRSDRLWERHFERKWGPLIGESARREWQCRVRPRRAAKSGVSRLAQPECWPQWARSVSRILPVEAIFGSDGRPRCSSSSPVDSVMAWYLALESGQLWFPAQVYNRENGHAGFMLSCYDAKISYDSKTDTFLASYSSHGRGSVEEDIPWHRLRAPPLDNPPHQLNVSDCLSSLKPGNHVEIQWRKSKGFPYGWWYGVVGHLESCDGNEKYCQCDRNDMVILEFSQYPPESRWRRTTINRKSHREEGDEVNGGFYGGIRKLCDDSEISTWKSLSSKKQS